MKQSCYALALPVALAAGLGTVRAQTPPPNLSSFAAGAGSASFSSAPGAPVGAPLRGVVLITWNSAAPRAFLHGRRQRTFPAAPRSTQGYLGIDIRDVSDDRLSALRLKESRGAEIIHVDHDGPAGMAGLCEHDVILQMNGQVIEGEEQLRRMLRETPAGRGITIVLSRDGQQQTVSAQMADRAAVEREAEREAERQAGREPGQQRTTAPDLTGPSGLGTGMRSGFFGGAPVIAPVNAPPITAPPDPHARNLIGTAILGSSYTGAVLEMIGPQLAQFFGSQGGNGLLVRSVDPNSPAAAAGLRAGDVVVRANAVIIAELSEWARLVRESKGRPLSVVIVRDKQEQTLVVVPDAKKRSSMDLEALPTDARPSPEDVEAKNSALLWMN